MGKKNYKQKDNYPKCEAKKRINKENLLIALKNNLGNATAATKECGLNISTFYYYYKSDPDFKEKVDMQEKMTIDFVEHSLMKKIAEGSERCMIFYLSRRSDKYKDKSKIDIDVNHKVEQPLFYDLDYKDIKVIDNKKDLDDDLDLNDSDS